MTIDTLLELDGLSCVEPSFAELTDDYYTTLVTDAEPEDARLLVDEDENPLAVAVREEGSWYVASFAFRTPTIEVIELMEHTGGDIYQQPRSAWITALREYYSAEIVREFPLAPEDTREERIAMTGALLQDIWGDKRPGFCLDCCCGSGIGSSALRRSGITTLAYDNDPALLALGFETGRLLPAETMWIDATQASKYTDPAPAGIGLMLGDIRPYNAAMWEEIVAELLGLTDETVITVATEPEIMLVEKWCMAAECGVEIFENERDPIYDRWVCIARHS
jgi:hypothetical protein